MGYVIIRLLGGVATTTSPDINTEATEPELSTEPTTVTQPIIQPDTTFSVVTQPIIQPQTSSVSTVTQPIPTLPVSVVTQSIPTLGAAGATSRGTTKIVTTVAPSPVALKDLIRTTSQPNLFIQLPQLRVLKQNGTEESSNLNHTRSNHKSNSTTTANRTAHISSPILQINKSAIDNSSQVIRIDRTNFTTELTPVDDADLSTNSNNNAIPDDLFHSLNTTSTQPSENNNVDSRKLHFTW